MAENGNSVLLKFQSTEQIQKCIQEVFLNNNDVGIQYEIQYIKIEQNENDAVEIAANFIKSRHCKKRKNLDPKYQEDLRIKRQRWQKNFETPKHELQKEKMRDYQKDAYDKIKGTEKHDRVKKQMRKCSKELYDKLKARMCEDQNRSTKKTCTAERLEKFNESVKQGPYYICVSCNRCHYMRSIVQFKEERYNLQEDDVFTDVLSFDGKKYICHTCHQKLMKGNIPAQAVFNKLQVHRLPFELMDVRKLEKAIIARRFLFKKVTIMPKCQMPKIKRAICNVPFDTGEVFNILPRGSDSTGIVMVKLKRKLMYTGHVIFEPIRPEKVKLLLEYLKVNNPFIRILLLIQIILILISCLLGITSTW